MVRVKLLVLLPVLIAGQTLVLIGGNLRDDNSQVWNSMVAAAGGRGVARIGVVAREATSDVQKIVDNFVRLYGANAATFIRVNAYSVRNFRITRAIRRQTGIYLFEQGEMIGQRLRFLNVLMPFGVDTRAMRTIRTVLRNGGMIAGNSALMGRKVAILGGDSISALLTGTQYEGEVLQSNPLRYSLPGGLSFIENYLIESNLSEKGREGRLIRALMDTKDETNISKGFGVDENTALVVTNTLANPTGKVVTADGEVTGVSFFGVEKVPSNAVSNCSYQNVVFSFYTMNDTIELNSERVTFAPWKVPITGEEHFEHAVPSKDIFSQRTPNEWRKTARRLINCKETIVTSFSAQPSIVRVSMDRSQAVGYGAHIPGSTVYVPSFYKMRATIDVVEKFEEEEVEEEVEEED